MSFCSQEHAREWYAKYHSQPPLTPQLLTSYLLPGCVRGFISSHENFLLRSGSTSVQSAIAPCSFWLPRTGVILVWGSMGCFNPPMLRGTGAAGKSFLPASHTGVSKVKAIRGLVALLPLLGSWCSVDRTAGQSLLPVCHSRYSRERGAASSQSTGRMGAAAPHPFYRLAWPWSPESRELSPPPHSIPPDPQEELTHGSVYKMTSDWIQVIFLTELPFLLWVKSCNICTIPVCTGRATILPVEIYMCP